MDGALNLNWGAPYGPFGGAATKIIIINFTKLRLYYLILNIFYLALDYYI